MDRRYTILAILLVVAAFGLLILPDRGKTKEINPRELLIAVDDPARFLSTDLITERIIGGDPSLQLIDVRTADQFNQYALQGAINIPLDSLLSPQWKEILLQPGKDKVFYSNADIESDQAWQICRRNSIPRIYVMKGGLNLWFSTIMNSVEPPATAPSQAIDLYKFRMAAKQFFTGGSAAVSTEQGTGKGNTNKGGEEVKVIKKDSPKTGGGC